jgi:hypothetical protein
MLTDNGMCSKISRKQRIDYQNTLAAVKFIEPNNESIDSIVFEKCETENAFTVHNISRVNGTSQLVNSKSKDYK